MSKSLHSLLRRGVVLLALMFASRVAAAGPTTRPYVLHLPGIGGTMYVDRMFVKGLRAGHCDAEIQIYDWTEHDPGIDALHAIDRNRKQAAHVAGFLGRRIERWPDERIVITSHSGGGALAVWTLEDLPRDARVDDVFLLAPALSPNYDLTPALSHVRGHMYVFSSESDELVLGFGCRMFGTMDGVLTDAAGRVGFVRPRNGDPEEYRKLINVPYQAAWLRYGNYGDHIGPMAWRFVAHVVAPLVIGEPNDPPAN